MSSSCQGAPAFSTTCVSCVRQHECFPSITDGVRAATSSDGCVTLRNEPTSSSNCWSKARLCGVWISGMIRLREQKGRFRAGQVWKLWFERPSLFLTGEVCLRSCTASDLLCFSAQVKCADEVWATAEIKLAAPPSPRAESCWQSGFLFSPSWRLPTASEPLCSAFKTLLETLTVPSVLLFTFTALEIYDGNSQAATYIKLLTWQKDHLPK